MFTLVMGKIVYTSDGEKFMFTLVMDYVYTSDGKDHVYTRFHFPEKCWFFEVLYSEPNLKEFFFTY